MQDAHDESKEFNCVNTRFFYLCKKYTVVLRYCNKCNTEPKNAGTWKYKFGSERNANILQLFCFETFFLLRGNLPIFLRVAAVLRHASLLKH